MTVSTAVRWPSIARTPRAPLAATVARLIFERAVHPIPVRATYPNGTSIGGARHCPGFEVVRPSAFFARLGRDTKIGFGEAYMAGDWRAGPARTWPTCSPRSRPGSPAWSPSRCSG